jgi:alcohol dehydrogenase
VDEAVTKNTEAGDVVIEVCGDPSVIPQGIECLRTGGRYVLGGVVNPESFARVDANQILRKLVTLRGVHNYHPKHLGEALDFVVANRGRFPFHDLVDGKYPLHEVGKAMRDAADRRVLRAAILP